MFHSIFLSHAFCKELAAQGTLQATSRLTRSGSMSNKT